MAILDRIPFMSDGLPSATSSKRIIASYIFDYVVVVVLISAFLSLDAIEPFHQQFSLRNYTLQYTFAVKERVPNLLLVALSCLAPAVIIAFYTLVVDGIFSHKVLGVKRKYSLRERLWELNCGLLGLALAVSMQYVIVGSLKNAIGKPRPDLIDRCQPKEGSIDPQPFGLSNITICTRALGDPILKDGFRSFPSGHSSTSFGGLFYLSLYLAGKLHILDSRGEVWKLFTVLTPSLGAALIAGSRIMDARHHPFDVISGSLIGIVIAWAAYRQYFPALYDFRAKGRAYPMRTWGRDPLGKKDNDYDYTYRTGGAVVEDATKAPGSSGNYFRDEVAASQRRRVQSPIAKTPSSDTESDFTPPPPVPAHEAGVKPVMSKFAGQSEVVPAPIRRDSEEYELQPQYTLSGPSGQLYDPYHTTTLPKEDTSYRGSTPVTRLPSMRSPEGKKVYPLPAEARPSRNEDEPTRV